MTIGQIYKKAIELGIKADLRGEKEVRRQMAKLKERYSRLSGEKKEEFDMEKLENPYSDTRILFGELNQEIKCVLAGIDIDDGELLLGKYLASQGKKIDMAMAHHPSGPALADLSDVMSLQADVLADYGVPINIAEGVLRPRISEVARGMLPINHNKTVDAARLLELPLGCFHTVADNLAANFLDKFLKKEKPETLREIVMALKKIPEYSQAAKDKAGPKIFVGRPESRTGRIALSEITGGTEGAKEIYQSMANAGIGTVIAMHLSEAHRAEAEKAHVNIVIAGHISSDSLGMNLLLDEIEKKGVQIIPCSGLIRVRRAKK